MILKRPWVQAQRGSHILRMGAFTDLIHRPDPQRLKSLVIKLPAVVIPHSTILPDHKIKVRLLSNSLVSAHLRPGAAVSWQGLNFDFTGVVFDGGDFTAARFSGGIEVSFGGAKFSGGEVSFHLRAKFSGAQINFSQAEFSGAQVSFSQVEFSGGQVEFRFARFSGGEVDFGAAFSGGREPIAGTNDPGQCRTRPYAAWAHHDAHCSIRPGQGHITPGRHVVINGVSKPGYRERA